MNMDSCLLYISSDLLVSHAMGEYAEIFDSQNVVGRDINDLLSLNERLTADELKQWSMSRKMHHLTIHGQTKALQINWYCHSNFVAGVHYVLCLTDVSPLEHLQHSLHKADVLLETMNDQPSLILVYNLDYRIEYVNRRVSEALSKPVDEIIGKNVLEVIEPENVGRAKRQLARLTTDSPLAVHEHRQDRLDEHGNRVFRWLQWTDRLIMSKSGKPLGYQCIGYDITERKLAEIQMEDMLHKDPLTAVLNRRRFFELAKMELAKAEQYKVPSSLILIDADFFKAINDTYGHNMGDKVLKTLADTLNLSVREHDLVCRYGGEEFLILLPSTEKEEAHAIAEDLRTSVELLKLNVQGIEIQFTISLGVSCYLGKAEIDTLEHWIVDADNALYKAKKRGRNCVVTSRLIEKPITI